MRLAKTMILGASLGFVFLAKNAYAFDNSRFSQVFSRPHTAGPWLTGSQSSMSDDDFSLSRTGKIEETSHAKVVNINVSSSAAPTSAKQAESTNFTADETAEKMNRSYSDFVGTEERAAVCGPSPMTPAEIEKLVGSTAEAYDVDPRFAKAITWVETRFDRARNSPKGARGPMQLMPETALQLGVDDICDPVSNIDGGVRRLKALLDEFQNPLLAAAAYNAGSRAIYDHGGIPPYGETIGYVASVINHQLGLPAQPVGAKAHATVSKDNSSMSNEQTNGVFGAKGSRFVNGVMHF